MSEKILANFYSVKQAPLVELLNLERTGLVCTELEQRARQEIEKTFRLYQEVYGSSAIEKFSDDAAVIFKKETN